MQSQLKENLIKAMKARNEIEVGALRMLLSNIQTTEANQGPLNEDQFISVVKKVIGQNEEEISVRRTRNTSDDITTITKLEAENTILRTYLPTFMSESAIYDILNQPEILSQILATPKVGAAVGIAMRTLKTHGKVEGETVKKIVESLYGPK